MRSHGVCRDVDSSPVHQSGRTQKTARLPDGQRIAFLGSPARRGEVRRRELSRSSLAGRRSRPEHSEDSGAPVSPNSRHLLRNRTDISRAIARGVTNYQCLTIRGENRA